MGGPNFTKVAIGELVNDAVPRGAMNTFLAVGDVNGDGLKNIVVCGRNGRMAWFENAGENQEVQDRWIPTPNAQ